MPSSGMPGPGFAKLQDARLQMRIHCQAADTDIRPWDAKLQDVKLQEMGGGGWGIALCTIIHKINCNPMYVV